jgi:hypothetical protein
LARPGWLMALVLIAACGLSWLHQDYYDFQHDDAYITYRYAENWATGHGPVFNPGERVEGYTNFLHLLVLTGATQLGLDVVSTSRALGTIACCVTIVVMAAFVLFEMRRSWGWAASGAIILALHAGLAAWARSGLETLPFVCLVLVTLLVHAREVRTNRAHVVSGLLFGLVALLRADGFLFVLAASVFAMLVGRRRALPILLGAFSVIVVPHLIWRYSYYGELLPNSFYVRSGGGRLQQLRGLFYTYEFIKPFGGLLLFALPLLLVAFRDPQRDRVRLFLGTNVVLIGAYVVWVGGDHMPIARFYMPIVAPMTILWLETIAELAARMPAWSAGARRALASVVAVCGVVIVAISGFMPTLDQRRLPYTHVLSGRTFVEHWSRAGQWFHDHIEADQTLATSPAGAVPYFAKLRTIDMLGVNDKHIARLEPGGMGGGSAAHEKRDFMYVLSLEPDIIFTGVHDAERTEEDVVQPDGSRYRMRCVALGEGTWLEEFGQLSQRPLFLTYDERVADPAP